VGAAAMARQRSERSDARANRGRILNVARALMANGENVPMAQIAEQAGVGIGTLYRHFPNREHLIIALVCTALEGVLERIETACVASDSGIDAIGRFFDATIDARAELFLPFHGAPLVPDSEITKLQARVRHEIDRVLAAGFADQTIRRSVTAEDIVVAAASLARPLPQIEDWSTVARRQANILLTGLQAPDAPAPGRGARRT
jgi:AcrR family transcriptional regulator